MTSEVPGAAPWLSILIPVYNVAPYLRACIASIAPQLPAEGVEVLLLDDASTDGSLQICEEVCAEQGAAFRLIRHPVNAGVSAARNGLLDQARGDYVWFVDSDDEIMPGMLARLRGIVDRHAPDLLLFDYDNGEGKDVRCFAGPENRFSTDREALVRGFFTARKMHLWNRIARRHIWGADLRFPVGRCFEDMTTMPFLVLRAQSFYYDPTPCIRYYMREGSITGQLARTRGSFDDRMNDDVAVSLAGFADAARTAMPDMDDETRYCIGQFWAKEFTKLWWRLISARFGRDSWRDIRAKLRRYRALMEENAPVAFAELNRAHLRRGKPGRWFVLSLCLLLAPAPDRPARVEATV